LPDILSPLFAGPQVEPLGVLVRLIAAWVLGAAVAFIYRKTRPADAVLASFPGTLVLLAVLIAMVTQVIGDNVARAFSLVGALSIVRFRTVVRDTQDTAYVIFAVAVGMSVGANALWVALAGLVVTAAAAFVMKLTSPAVTFSDLPYVLEMRISLGVDPVKVLIPSLEQHLRNCRLQAITTARQGLALDVSYTGLLSSDDQAGELVKSVNRIEGVQQVSLRRAETGDG
jgi:uncharacterized membrane protein YhiD involved in acid resistance